MIGTDTTDKVEYKEELEEMMYLAHVKAASQEEQGSVQAGKNWAKVDHTPGRYKVEDEYSRQRISRTRKIWTIQFFVQHYWASLDAP